MVSKKKRKNANNSQYSVEQTTNLPQISPNATLGPNASLYAGTSGVWKGEDSTNIPPIGEEEEEKKDVYANTIPAFADKYIQKVIPSDSLVPLLVVCCIGWIFIQDNSSGNLKDWLSVWWTIQKCFAVLIFLIILFFVARYIVNVFSKNKK
jgi:hypothetical protein